MFFNLDEVLKSCDADSTRLAHVRVYLRQMENWPIFNEMYAAWIGSVRPARCVVPVPNLPGEVELELEAVAIDS